MAGIIVVGMGDYKLGESPGVIRTVLGSCVGVCLYDERSRKGAMLHIMLPSSAAHANLNGFRRQKFADTGIEDMISDVKKQFGLLPAGLKAKLFGGARVLGGLSSNIGQENTAAAKTKLQEYRIPVVASKLGGEKGYQIDFDLQTGKVACRVFGEEEAVY